MPGENSLVSVIVAVYNGGAHLSQALDSAFAQDYSPLEIIVIDDGSTDNTAEVAQSRKGVIYLHQEHQGVATARNAALDVVSGEYVAFLDADDLWVPHKVSLQVNYLRAHPGVGGTVGRYLAFRDDDALALNDIMSGRYVHQPSPSDYISLVTLLARREAFDRVGRFDISYRVGSDSEWFTRAKDAGVLIHVLPDMLLYWRVHGSNLSLDKDARRESLLRMFMSSIKRQREQGND